jgi:outer membrane protein OmpA-like peptidoglycan-associated protein
MKFATRNMTATGLLAILGLAGCTAASGPTFSAYSVALPDGGQAYRVICGGILEGPQVCQREAQKICHGQDVRVLEGVSPLGQTRDGSPDKRELTFQCGVPPQAAPLPVPVPVSPQALTLSSDTAFDTGKATLTPVAQTQLDQLIEQTRGQKAGTVTVSGYTDSVGPDTYNLGLSQRRVESVVAYLRKHGLRADHFDAHAFGKADPVASNATAAGRARNRRVEVRLSTIQEGPGAQ